MSNNFKHKFFGVVGGLSLGFGIFAFLGGYSALGSILLINFFASFIFFYDITKKIEDEKKELEEEQRKRVAETLRHNQERELEKQRQRIEYLNSPEGRRETLINNLTDISGVSEKIARTLLDQFPTFESIDEGSEEEIGNVPGVGKNLARAIKARIRNLKNN